MWSLIDIERSNLICVKWRRDIAIGLQAALLNEIENGVDPMESVNSRWRKVIISLLSNQQLDVKTLFKLDREGLISSNMFSYLE